MNLDEHRGELLAVLDYAIVRRRGDVARFKKMKKPAWVDHANQQIEKWTKLMDELAKEAR